MKDSSSRYLSTVGILLFPSVEELDFAGPYGVFANATDENKQPYCRVLTIGTAREIRTRGGLHVLTDYVLQEQIPPLDLLIVPGGPKAREDFRDERIATFLRQHREQTPIVASVCTGAFLLAFAGYLEGRRSTTHTSRIGLLRQQFPQLEVVAEKIVDTGDVVTAGGVTSGIDLALYFLEKWYGPEARRREAKRLDGPWS